MENRYISHEIVKKIFENNKNFYDDVVRENFDIKLFEQSFRKKRWSPRQVVGFLAFGRILDVDVVMNLLEKWVPNWRPQFWWFVFLEKIQKM